MRATQTTLWVSTIIICFLFVSILPISADTYSHDDQPIQTLESMIQDVRGGFGVKATISNYQLAWGNRPVHWIMTVEGEHVMFGTSSGYIDSMSAGKARSSLIPPTIGWGSVTVTIKVTVRTGQPDEGIISQTQRSGFILGPVILLL